MRRFHEFLAACTVLACAHSTAEAQELQGVFAGDTFFDIFGLCVAGAGDVNGDGLDDFLAGGYRGDMRGRVKVISGADGAVLHTIIGAPGERIGYFVAAAGDVNGDGFADFMESSPDAQTKVFSGLDGALLYTFDAGLVGAYRDSNSDGFDDFIVGDSLRSGADGSTLRVFPFGIFRLAGDVDADGTEDYISFSGSPLDLVTVRSGIDDSLILELPFLDLRYAQSAGDVNADGHADIIIAYQEPKLAIVYSGLDGAVIYEHELNMVNVFFPVAPAGDSDGDGHDDYLIAGIPSSQLHSGRTGCVLAEFVRHGGLGIASAGDIDGDGDPDVVVGTPVQLAPITEAGTAAWYTYDGPVGSNYCNTIANSTGSSGEVSASGSTSIARNDLLLAAGFLPPTQPGLFYYGGGQIAVPFGDGVRCVGGGATGTFRLPASVSDVNGCLHTRIDNSNSPAGGTFVSGSTWFFQGWFRDPAAQGTSFNLTDGLAISFVP